MPRHPRLPALASLLAALAAVFTLLAPALAFAEGAHEGGGEASLVLPDLGRVNFLGPRPGAPCSRAGS